MAKQGSGVCRLCNPRAPSPAHNNAQLPSSGCSAGAPRLRAGCSLWAGSALKAPEANVDTARPRLRRPPLSRRRLLTVLRRAPGNPEAQSLFWFTELSEHAGALSGAPPPVSASSSPPCLAPRSTLGTVVLHPGRRRELEARGGATSRSPHPIGPDRDGTEWAWRKSRVSGEFVSNRVSIGPAPVLRPSFFFFLSRVMAAPKTQGAATHGEDSDGNCGGAGGVSYEGEYGASEVQMVFCLRFSPTWNTADCWTDLSSKASWARGGHGWSPAGQDGVGGGYLLESLGGKKKWDEMALSAVREVPWVLSYVWSSHLYSLCRVGVGQGLRVCDCNSGVSCPLSSPVLYPCLGLLDLASGDRFYLGSGGFPFADWLVTALYRFFSVIGWSSLWRESLYGSHSFFPCQLPRAFSRIERRAWEIFPNSG